MTRTTDLGRFFALLDGMRETTPDDAEFLFDPNTDDGALRRDNLRRYLDLLGARGSGVMLVAEAPGHRGTSVTGVPFMSVRELEATPGLITGDEAGDGFRRPAHPTALWEASSRVVWASLARWRGPLPVSWPIYPNHPFVAGSPLTNRTPRPAEIRAGTPIALALAEAFGIERIVAVGRKSQGALASQGVAADAVRHPAQGGARQFAEGLAALNEAMA
ncbi:uracil-DNA glycosylase [Frondihabitans cladoniiphilus]|uniref:Uracil-DNA glycosylase n=1 Tax=Frondihabitans cladoniiphilus TaxID=715785 RepID=A0ABP8W265_9MICO